MESYAQLGLLIGTIGTILLSLDLILGEKLVSRMGTYAKALFKKFLVSHESAPHDRVENVKKAFADVTYRLKRDPLTRDIAANHGQIYLGLYIFLKSSFKTKIIPFLIVSGIVILLSPVVIWLSILMFLKTSYIIYELSGVHVAMAAGFIMLIIGITFQYLSYYH